MARFKRLEHGLLTIGMVSTAKYFVPQLLARSARTTRAWTCSCAWPATANSWWRCCRGEVDLAVMGRPPKELATRSEAFAAHPMVVVGPPGPPAATVPQAPVAALAPYPFIVREQGSGTRKRMQQFFSRTPLHAQHHDGDLEQRDHQAGGDRRHGPELPVAAHVGLELRSGLLQVLDIAGTPVMRTWNVVHLQSRTLSPLAEAFRYFLIEHGEQHLLAHDRPLLAPDAAAEDSRFATSL
jgi:DNA-binding transcriptional LysR family regulator